MVDVDVLSEQELTDQRNQPNGVASLNADAETPFSTLPSEIKYNHLDQFFSRGYPYTKLPIYQGTVLMQVKLLLGINVLATKTLSYNQNKQITQVVITDGIDTLTKDITYAGTVITSVQVS